MGVGTRSAMMTSLLPAPCERRSLLLLKQKNKLHDKAGKSCRLAESPVHPKPELEHEVVNDEEVQEDMDNVMHDTLFKHTWAFTRGRKVHDPAKKFEKTVPL